MKMAFVDGTDQVIVVHTGRRDPRLPGDLHPRVLRARQGLPDRRRLTGGERQPAGTLTCALHLSRFDLADGEALDPPAEIPLAMYPVVIEDGRVLIEVPDGPLPVNE